MLGQTISHYKILQKLGAGGMGVVYKAQDLKLDRFVVLKFLSSDLTRDEKAKERFIIEAKAASALDHPNVCTIYEINEADDGQLFIAMAYYEGETLAAKIKQQKANSKASLDWTIDIATQIAQGLARAHEAGIVHRDIKPANIIITKRNEVKILDFGLAKLAGQQHLTKSGATLGTIAYMSPQQAQGLEVDHRTDIWSLGVVMYEMLTGQLPFQGHYDQAVMYAIVNVAPAAVRSLRSEVSGRLEEIVNKALQKPLPARYQSMDEFLSDLRVSDTSQKAGTKISTSKRNKIRSGIFSGLLLLAVVISAVLWMRLKDISVQPKKSISTTGSANRIAVFPFTVRGSDKFAYLREGMVDLLSAKLDDAGDLRTVDPRTLLNYVAQNSGVILTPEHAKAFADHFGAGLYVLGSIVEAGGRMDMSASIYEANKGLKMTVQTSVDEEARIIHGINDLAIRLLAEQGNEPTARLTRVAGITTSSLTALKAYLKGESEQRKGETMAARRAYEQAVKEDSAFALAWYRLSDTSLWGWQLEQSRIAAKRAMQLSDHLPRRDKLLLEASFAHLHGAAGEAERFFREATRAYPDDAEAWYGLAKTLFHLNPLRGRSMIESREAIEQVLLLDPSHRVQNFLLIVTFLEGKPAEFDSLLRVSFPKGDIPPSWRASQALLKNDAALWKQVLGELKNADGFTLSFSMLYPSAMWIRWTAFPLDSPLDSREIGRLLTEPSRSPEWRSLGHLQLAFLEMAQGRWRSAQKELKHLEALNQALAIEYQASLALTPLLELPRRELQELRDAVMRWDAASVLPSMDPLIYISAHNGVHSHLRGYLLGLLSLRLGEEKKTEQITTELERMKASANAGSLLHDLALSLHAQLAVSRGQQSQALSLLKQLKMEIWHELAWASSFYGQTHGRFLRAELLNASGRYEEALNWYNFEGGFPNWNCIAPSHLRRAEIYEKLGQTENAIEHYARFIRLWKNCDPELRPKVEEAQKRLAQLQLQSDLRN